MLNFQTRGDPKLLPKTQGANFFKRQWHDNPMHQRQQITGSGFGITIPKVVLNSVRLKGTSL